MALGYNDRQRLLGLPENENADLDNLVEAPEFQQFQNAQDSSDEMEGLAQPERQFAQSKALENSSSVAPINEESDIPVQTRVPAATDVSAQIKTRSDSSSQAQYNPQTGEAPDLMTQYRKLMDQKKAELEGARKAEMLQNMLSGINSNVGLIIGGNAAKNSGAAVTAPKLGDLAKTDYAGNVDQEMKPELEGLMEQYKMLQQEKQAKANRDIQEQQLKIAREGLDVKRMLADKKASTAGMTEAQKVFDRSAAKRIEDWDINRGTIEADIEKLKQVEKQLANKDLNVSGPIKGSMWGQKFHNPEGVNLQDTIGSVTQKNLREILGGQFAQKEGEQILQRAYNPEMEEKYNLERVQSLRMAMEQAMKEKDRLSRDFRERGILRTTGEEVSAPAVDNSDPKIDAYAKQHGLDYSKAEKILRARGYNGR